MILNLGRPNRVSPLLLVSALSYIEYCLSQLLYDFIGQDQPQQTILSTQEQFKPNDNHCPIDSPISCHIPKQQQPIDSCCTNLPGGQLLLTQFWDTQPSVGPVDSWTIHGLWPDNCDGTYEASCDPTRNYHNITQILERGGGSETLKFMKSYWKDQRGDDEHFWQHEWGKHGTCISTLEPHCARGSYEPQSEVVTFFNRTVQLFKELPTYSWLAAGGIVPSKSVTYSLDQLQAVARKEFGHEAVWNCRGHTLNEVWWHFNTRGAVADGKFLPTDPVGPRSTCPHTGIQYIPKHGSGGGDDDRPHNPKNPHVPSPGRERSIYVVNSSGEREGCLIGSGNWYRSGTCASFSVSTSSGSEILEIKSRKGPCTFSEDGFSCSKELKTEGFSFVNGKFLTHKGQEKFYASSIPEGITQIKIIKDKAQYPIQLEVSPAN
ncbi:ribonuclease T2-like protein [Phakopsora pachyrhizi]|nr:ribonuclease T2-like protein [Phakopsora pachyrhizi]